MLSFSFVSPVYADTYIIKDGKWTLLAEEVYFLHNGVWLKKVESIKEKVVKIFADNPRMVDVIGCESHFQQFDSNGNPLRSKTSDIGIGQINKVWWKDAANRGLDIFNSGDDNLAMSRIIYDIQGISAWTCDTLV